MKSLYAKIAAVVLMVGLLSACGGQATSTSAATSVTSSSQGTQAPAAAAQPAAQGSTVSFVKDVLPIIQSRCTNCHGGNRTEKGLNLNTYNALMTGSENGPVITAGQASDSLLVQLITEQKMPKRGPALTPPQVQTITDWVNQGALNN